VVGEQRYGYVVEELDRMTDAVLVEVKRHGKSYPRRKVDSPAEVVRLLHLVDRAADGRLLANEARLLREGIQRLAREARDGA
jgi:hypothetical protein